MDISIIIGLVTIWLTILGFMFTLVNGQKDLRKDLEEKIEKSTDSIKKEAGEFRKDLEQKIKNSEESVKQEIRDIRKEIASLYRLLISQGRHYEDPEDKKIA